MTQVAQERLEPCPFCSGEAILLKDHKRLGVYVACQSCYACTVTDSRPDAMVAWNRRASAEIWRAIPGWEGAYEASSDGRIRSLDRTIMHADGGARAHRGRILRPKVSNRGYLMVGLFDAEKQKRAFTTVHRLIASAFIPNPEGLPEVNHIDGNKGNCARTNLEWCSSSQNSRHSTQNRLNPVAKLSDDQVRAIVAANAAGVTKRQLARQYGVAPRAINSIVAGDTYTWVDRASQAPTHVSEAMVEALRQGIIERGSGWHPSFEQCRSILTAALAVDRPAVAVPVGWNSQPTPAQAAAQLREYARKQRSLHGTCPPGDNIFEDAAAVIDRLAAAPAPQGDGAVEVNWPRGTRVEIEHDGFVGPVIGEYERLDGYRGAVVQFEGKNIVHCYGEKFLPPSALQQQETRKPEPAIRSQRRSG